MKLDATHDPALRSWVPSANLGGTDFPIQNLPHGVFRRRSSPEAFRGAVAIGDEVLDMAAAVNTGVFPDDVRQAAQAAAMPCLNALMGLGRPAWRRLRAELSRLLRDDSPAAAALAPCLVPLAAVEMALPAQVGDYTDFFSSWHHMVNAGRIFQPDAPPLPNFKWLPLAYHGRASTVVASGTNVRRPWGITREPGAEPAYRPVRQLDHELELAVWMGGGPARGRRIGIEEAEDHIFGVGLLNDWSARDVQAFESMPLGPFLAKNFQTSVSPWIVTLDALAPFRCALSREPTDPPALPHLQPREPLPGLALELQVLLQTPGTGSQSFELSRSNLRHGYWALSQMVAHHTEGGCALRPGDLLGTGTQSGPGPREQGCLLELTRHGREPLPLAEGLQRGYLEDGDTVLLRAWAEREGARRIGLGECRGTVLPAAPDATARA